MEAEKWFSSVILKFETFFHCDYQHIRILFTHLEMPKKFFFEEDHGTSSILFCSYCIEFKSVLLCPSGL